jgi:hypothetical protein
MRKAILIFLFCISGIIFSQERAFFSDTGSIFFDYGDYNFVIILVPNLQVALDQFYNPDQSNESSIDFTTSVNIGEQIAILIVFRTIKDNINLTYNFSTMRPDGTFSEKRYEAMVIHEGQARRNVLQVGRQLPIAIYYNEDPVGKYQYHLDIYDDNVYLCTAVLEFAVRRILRN